MLPSLVHLRHSRSTGVGYYDLPENARLALVTIEHERAKPDDVKAYDEYGQLIPQLADKVYGTLRIAVQAQANMVYEEAWQLEPVSLRCFRAAAIEAYDAVADVAIKQTEAEDQAHRERQARAGEYAPLDYESPIDHFHYLRRHLVVVAAGARNFQPQQFIQRDTGSDLSFARNVLYEQLGNLSSGLTLMEVPKPYEGAAQNVDELNREHEERLERAQNREPESIFYMDTDDRD